MILRGGKREGAGRKKTGQCRDAPHRTRPELDFRHPVHVVLRLRLRIEALTHGMQGFAVSFARGYHARRGGCDKVFTYRYHATQIRTRRHARHALAYVLNNWRRHRVDWENGQESPWRLDPFSSAISFTGWTRRFRARPNYDPLPVSAPGTALLRSGWQHYGRISPFEVPGPLA